MKFRKVMIISIIIIAVTNTVACSTNQQDRSSQIDLFDMKQAREISERYFSNISTGKLNNAIGLCSSELVNSNKDLTMGISDITAFSLDSTIEGKNFGYFIFNVIRTSGKEPKSDLENFTVKVQKLNNTYSITEIKAKSEKELYVKENKLRIIGDEGGKSNLIISLNNIPKDTYLRENKMMLYKDKVPNDSFGNVALSFTGKRVAITTTDTKDSYVCIALIDDALMTFTDTLPNGASAATPNGIEEIQQALENSIAKKLIPVDLLKNSKVNKYVFSKEEDILDVEFINEYNVNRINLYKTDDGSIIDTELNKIFPEDKYNITAGVFNDAEFNFIVTPADGKKDIQNELIGEYKINVMTMEINKL